MTPRDLLVDLRDIHTPTTTADSTALLQAEPLILFAALIALAFGWAIWRGRRWRREAATALRDARALGDPREKWRAMTALLARLSRLKPGGAPPDYLFLPPARIDADLLAALDAEIERRLS